jgi:hypothetical protein
LSFGLIHAYYAQPSLQLAHNEVFVNFEAYLSAIVFDQISDRDDHATICITLYEEDTNAVQLFPDRIASSTPPHLEVRRQVEVLHCCSSRHHHAATTSTATITGTSPLDQAIAPGTLNVEIAGCTGPAYFNGNQDLSGLYSYSFWNSWASTIPGSHC